MHDDGVRLGQLQALFRQAKALEILLAGRQQRTAHALVLQAQRDDDVTVLDAFFQVMKDAHTHAGHVSRHQRTRADHAHFSSAQRGQRVNVGTRHARMQHVTHNRHAQVGEILLVVADGVHVQQALCRVCVAAVTGVDHVHMRGHMLGNQVRRAGFAVAHHKHIGSHGREVVNGVQQRLPLAGRAARDVQIEHIG